LQPILTHKRGTGYSFANDRHHRSKRKAYTIAPQPLDAPLIDVPARFGQLSVKLGASLNDRH